MGKAACMGMVMPGPSRWIFDVDLNTAAQALSRDAVQLFGHGPSH